MDITSKIELGEDKDASAIIIKSDEERLAASMKMALINMEADEIVSAYHKTPVEELLTVKLGYTKV